MAVLTLDTATNVAAVAVGAGETPLASMASQVPRGHSRVLQPAIAAVLETASLQPTQLTQIVVGIGPGSYTGVRLGVATAKAMASALAIPLASVSTLLCMAESAVPYEAEDVIALPLLYARRKRAYGALYRKVGRRWEALLPPQVRPVSEWAQALHQRYADARMAAIVHDFEPKHKVLEDLPSTGEIRVHLSEVAPDLAPALLRLFHHQSLPSASGADIHTVVPDYALPVEAEVRLAEKEGDGQ